jgi:hypothetical protein
MSKPAWSLLVLLFLALPLGASTQTPMVATYITAEQVQEVNAFPGTDRQIISRDIGKLNLAVGVIHRGPTAALHRVVERPNRRPNFAEYPMVRPAVRGGACTSIRRRRTSSSPAVVRWSPAARS